VAATAPRTHAQGTRLQPAPLGAACASASLQLSNIPGLTEKAQRQIHFYHIDPATSSLPFNVATGVNVGDVVGKLCTHNNLGDCDIQGAQNFSHLALRLVFKLEDSGKQIGADDGEIKGFVATPRCLYDNWANIPGNPTTQSNPVHGCPQ